tara:strand:+ start:1673 stop:2062 length:390 start_codon:yes stop_codon:yes gene_type:complete
MAATSQYVSVVKNGTLAQATVANTGRDGTGTLATIHTAGATGARVDAIIFNAPGTVTAGMLRLFITIGADTRLLDEVPVVATTPSATVMAWRINYIPPVPMVLEAGAILKFSTNNAQPFNAIAIFAGDF